MRAWNGAERVLHDQENLEKHQVKLSKNMSVSDFDSAYFYAKDLKRFAASLGISVGNFRKTEIEALIRSFLATGSIPKERPVLPRKDRRERDLLEENALVINYVGDKKTKQYLLHLVTTYCPEANTKSGQWYWLNDWRRQQQGRGQAFTYEDLARKLLELMQTPGRLPAIPSALMNNFITAFLADAEQPLKGRQNALRAWEMLKDIPGPKTYAHYKDAFPQKRE